MACLLPIAATPPLSTPPPACRHLAQVRAELTDAAVAVYLNRLSDYLFTAARWAAQRAGEPETVWAKAAAAADGAA